MRKKSFQKCRKEWKNNIHRVVKWSMKTESFICSKHFKYRYLEILSMKCCCHGLAIHIWLKWMQILRTMLLVLLIKSSYLCWLWWYPWRKLCFIIHIESVTPENPQFFADKINRWGFVKPSAIVYTMCVAAWDTYLQIIKNWL